MCTENGVFAIQFHFESNFAANFVTFGHLSFSSVKTYKIGIFCAVLGVEVAAAAAAAATISGNFLYCNT